VTPIEGFSGQGRTPSSILDELATARDGDLDWRGGRAFSLVYFVDDPELESLQHEVAAMFLHENALNPFRYETLLRMETDIVAMGCDLFGASRAALTSGGTESIFLAVQTAREAARARGVEQPTLVCADTAHPAFAKACHYLDVLQVRVPHGADGRADTGAMADAVDERCSLVVGSAPCYPFGVIDPIDELAALAAARGTCCHVDACLGGWLLPWWEQLGQPVRPWRFDVDGVTSMSADIHKYGYAYKGASLVLYRDDELYRHQVFMYDSWPGGLYASSTTAGTRPAPPIAGAWATINHLGADGYRRLAGRVLDAATRFRAGIEAIDGLTITHEPDMSVFEFGSTVHDMDGVCDVMDEMGWNLDRQQGGLHLMVSPGHDGVVDRFCSDLEEAVGRHAAGRDTLHVYGGHVDGGTVGDEGSGTVG
jgi:glutamate/tyrosine decarboxylase-like PLP-dependent enzyme